LNIALIERKYHVKIFICLLVLTFIVNTPEAYALFGHVAAERNRREHAEQQVAISQQSIIEQQRLISRWQTTAFILGISSVVLLVAGAAIGSKTRRDHEN
jgi:hypothetical protein